MKLTRSLYMLRWEVFSATRSCEWYSIGLSSLFILKIDGGRDGIARYTAGRLRVRNVKNHTLSRALSSWAHPQFIFKSYISFLDLPYKPMHEHMWKTGFIQGKSWFLFNLDGIFAIGGPVEEVIFFCFRDEEEGVVHRRTLIWMPVFE